MTKRISLLLLCYLCFSSGLHATIQIIEPEEKRIASTGSTERTLNKKAVQYLIGEAKNIISEYKAGSTLFSLSPSETGRTIPSEGEPHSLSASGQKLPKLDLALSFNDINITNLAIEGVTFDNATFIEDVVITHISLIDGNRARLDFFQHEEEIVFVFDHGGYDYKLIQTDKLKIKRRKPLTGYGDGIDPVRVNIPSTETPPLK